MRTGLPGYHHGVSTNDTLNLCPLCAQAHPADGTCPAIALILLVERAAMARDGEPPTRHRVASSPPLATQAEWFLWDQGEPEPGDLPPPL